MVFVSCWISNRDGAGKVERKMLVVTHGVLECGKKPRGITTNLSLSHFYKILGGEKSRL